jgi:site-specific recombinase XerC
MCYSGTRVRANGNILCLFRLIARNLTEAEVERLVEVAKANRYGRRDAAMVLLAFRHGLRLPS